ncbi:hypothetical protein OUZ56_022437 [Daphnia magna]|uniref:Uncharacterized protein n=1 Tax=Daphnia magna TaxID=35525 RepID=A0ABR0AWI9_9CRUS|nr:hypothetical protein OUZ56_022437 [Daphnia magna]
MTLRTTERKIKTQAICYFTVEGSRKLPPRPCPGSFLVRRPSRKSVVPHRLVSCLFLVANGVPFQDD